MNINQLNIDKLNWVKMNNIIPVIIQHNISGEILMLGYMNKEALIETLKSKDVIFYSRKKNRLWKKGETSNNFLKVKDIFFDCDNDSILILANPIGPTCHKNFNSCFHPAITNFSKFYNLEQIFKKNILNKSLKSYTNILYRQGIKRMAQKVAEEGVEVALAAMGNNDNEIIQETSDLIYHLLILLEGKKLNFNMIIKCLIERNKG